MSPLQQSAQLRLVALSDEAIELATPRRRASDQIDAAPVWSAAMWCVARHFKGGPASRFVAHEVAMATGHETGHALYAATLGELRAAILADSPVPLYRMAHEPGDDAHHLEYWL